MTDDPFFLSVQAKGFSLIWEDGEPTQRGFKKQKLDAGKTNAFREQHDRLISKVGCTSWVRSASSAATTGEYLHQVYNMRIMKAERLWDSTGHTVNFNITEQFISLI